MIAEGAKFRPLHKLFHREGSLMATAKDRAQAKAGTGLNDDIGEQKRLALYRSQVRLREAEQRAYDLFLQNLVKGTSHLSLGQEAIAAGFAEAMGEACTAANRFYVHEKVHDEFAKKLTAKMGSLKMGNGLDEGVNLGPLVNKDGRDKVIELVDDAIKRGAKVLTGGKKPEGPGFVESVCNASVTSGTPGDGIGTRRA